MAGQLVTRFGTVRPFLKLLVTVVDFGATPEGTAGPEGAEVAAGPDGTQEGRPGGDRHRPADRVVAAPGAVRAAPGAGHGRLEGVRVLRAGAVAPDAAAASRCSRRTPPSGATRGRSCWTGRRGSRPGRPCWPRSTCPPRRASTWRRGPRCWTAPTARSPRGCRRTPRSCSTTTAGCTLPPWSRSPNPPPCVDLREAVEAMLPRVDLPEVLLEVFSWTGADQAFTSVTGGEARLKDLHVTIAALLVAHGCNVGYTPVIGGADALKYGRLSHVDQTYLRLATYRAANATLIDAPGGHPARAGVGRRPGRLRGRHAVRRPRPLGVRAAEPQVLRAPGRRHLAEHDQRPGGGARREGGGRHPARLPVRAGRPLRPRRRQASRR